jgi:hypothetical protein
MMDVMRSPLDRMGSRELYDCHEVSALNGAVASVGQGDRFVQKANNAMAFDLQQVFMV